MIIGQLVTLTSVDLYDTEISQSNVEIIRIASVAIFTSLLGQWLLEEMYRDLEIFDENFDKKSSTRYTIAAVFYISFATTGAMLSGIFLMKNYIKTTRENVTENACNGEMILSTVANSAFLTIFLLAILSFLFTDFVHKSEKSDEQKSETVTV